MESNKIKKEVCDSIVKVLKDNSVDDKTVKHFEEIFWEETKGYVFKEKNKFDGKVLWYSDRLGYGIICGTDGETYFIHHKDIVMSSIDEGRHRKHLLKGERVIFDWGWKAGTDNKERQAFNLKVVESEGQ